MLTTEQGVPYASLPLAVRHAAEKYFGSATGLKASVEVEGGKTFYEVEGKNGTAYAVWTGIGAAGTFLLGITVFGDAANMLRLLSFALILTGIIGMKLTG